MDMDRVFSIPIRVYYEDTDAGGVVYYANYLRYLERARTEWLRALEVEQHELSRTHGVLFAVRHACLEFLKPARLDDLLTVTVQVARHGAASLTFRQNIARRGQLLCEAEIKVACLDAARLTPRAVPPDIAAKIAAGG